MNDIKIVKQGFELFFMKPIKDYQVVSHLFDSEEFYISYLKKVLYFAKAVIEPLEKKGMNKSDSIVDVASGDGQMSLALSLLGYKNITLFDLDNQRLKKGIELISLYSEGSIRPNQINDSATNLDKEFDVLISYQTIEHLSDEGNYSIAKKECQIEFLTKINKQVKKLCYFNAPNRTFIIDGHDTGKPFFHFLPMSIKKYLINSGKIKCSWAGICRPVSISFINRYLPDFKLSSNYYAFNSMIEYMENYPPFDYMGVKIPKWNRKNELSFKKKTVRFISTLMGKNFQKVLPVLSVIYERK